MASDASTFSQPPPSPTVPTEDLPTSPRTTSLAATASINAGQQAQTQNDIRQNDSRHVSNSSRAGAASPVQRRAGTNAERRRSAVAMLNDPTVPAPGEMQQTNGDTFGRPPSRSFRAASPHTISRSPTMADPHHHSRAPSIGELHQELEQEQEAQVVSCSLQMPFDLHSNMLYLVQHDVGRGDGKYQPTKAPPERTN